MSERIVPESGKDGRSPQGVSEPADPESRQPQNANPLPEKPKSKRRGPGRPFPKGKSGNPKGRPRNVSSLTALLREKMDQICEYDKQQRTWWEIIVLATLKLAMEGNSSALREVWERLGGKVPIPEQEVSDPVRIVVQYEDSPIKNPSALDMSPSQGATGPRTRRLCNKPSVWKSNRSRKTRRLHHDQRSRGKCPRKLNSRSEIASANCAASRLQN